MANRIANAFDSWSAAINDMREPAFWVTYVVGFVVMFASFFLGFICHGKGFIWVGDGLDQQYMFFIQEGQWLRDLFNNFFVEGSFEIPMWSEQIGYGADYYYSVCATLGNPINLISVFASAENADLILESTVPLTLFLAGLSFLWYCSYKGFDAFASLAACYVYLFSGYSFIAYTQIYMLYPLLLAPLVLRGVDRLFDGQSPLGFIVAMALAFLNGVNTGYSICLMLLVYCLVKFFFLPGEKTVLNFAKWFGIIFGCICLSVLVAGVIFYPVASNILSQGRLSLEREYSILYSPYYYSTLIEGFISAVNIGADCLTGFVPLALLCIALLFASKRKQGDRIVMLKILFVVFSIALLLPFVGRVTNGFAYPNNRWVFGYSLLVSAIVAVMLPEFQTADSGKRKGAIAIVGIYALICLVCSILNKNYSLFAAFACLIACLAVWSVFKDRNNGLFRVGILVVIAVSCMSLSFVRGFSDAEKEIDFGAAYDVTVRDDPASLILEVDSHGDPMRYDVGAGVPSWRNGNWPLGISGSTFYNSYYNGYVDEYHSSLGLTTSNMNFSYWGLEARTAMEALGGVEYFITRKGDSTTLPPSFDSVVLSGLVADSEYEVHRTDAVIPLAYVSSMSMSRDTYDGFGMVERQEAMLQSVILEDGVKNEAHLTSHVESLPFEIALAAPEGSTIDILNSSPDADDAEVYVDGSEIGTVSEAVRDGLTVEAKGSAVEVSDGSIEVREPGTVLYLDVDIPADREAYFCISGLNYHWLSERDTCSKEEWEDMGFLSKAKIELKSLVATPANESFIFLYSDGVKRQIHQLNGGNHLYGGKTDWAVNLGYSKNPRKTIALEFSYPGIYSFESIDIEAEDSKAVIKDIDKLVENEALNIVYKGNTLTCEVAEANPGDYLAVRFPYDKGWSAIVNGEAVDVVRSNVGFMAVPLGSGDNSIVLHYETPHFKVGALMTAIGLFCTILLAAVCRMRRSRRETCSDGR